ncbi:polyphosphate kinase 1 [Pasteurellaceae bacterium USgator11]|nr:polyphosphate kinase 1 [Pasteurellaceae bacterium USgator41]TNG97238.1 polyphosphate kinase 1 [Pasteurellaceae bacterium UScroc12]TNG99816.1 polyphosphate kinase 1 [Pasteurellaceae bacterium UScroc31]TNH01081.1 polyphosphate kinase 1 [Pasteurellaceae bacterium USgator11]
MLSLAIDESSYTSKELSWLAFNERVLQEAYDESNPLLERIRFLGIFASNLDEFYQVRFANLKHKLLIIRGQESQPAKQIRSQLAVIQQRTETLNKQFNEIYSRLMLRLAKHKIFLINETQLSPYHQNWLKTYFKQEIKPYIFPIILNEDIDLLTSLSAHNSNLIIELKKNKKIQTLAILPIPSDPIPRFIVLPKERYKRHQGIVLLDNVLRFCLEDIFDTEIFNYDEISAYSIKMTRDAEYDLITEVEYSLLELMSSSLKQRVTAQPVRFLYEKSMPKALLKMLKRRLNISSLDSVEAGGRYLSFKHLLQFPDLGNKELVNAPLSVIAHPQLKHTPTILEAISKKDILLYYPYHSFDTICELLRQASFDPKVTAIKINLYRVAKKSRVIEALMNAANNGKQVTVIIELQARFDEEANINWAKRLTDSNIKVVFSSPGFKIHSKLFLITRRENEQLVDYAHIGTGNFHESTARIYTDFALLTKNSKISEEVKRVFRFIEMPFSPTKFTHLLVSPINVRNRLSALINREIKHAQAGKKSGIILKINNLVDQEIVDLLYTASQAGVKIRMILRGMCSLRAGVSGLSENIQIISIIDRFLEHPRVYYFENDGDPDVYISSADWMTRNLDRRIEVGAPLLDIDAKQCVIDILNLQLSDNIKARIIDAEEKNKYVRNDQPPCRSQLAIHDYLLNQSNEKIKE